MNKVNIAGIEKAEERLKSSLANINALIISILT